MPQLFHTSGVRASRLASFPPVNNFFILAKGVDRSRRSGKLPCHHPRLLVHRRLITFAGLYRAPHPLGSRSNSVFAPGSNGSRQHFSSDNNESGSLTEHEQLVSTPVRGDQYDYSSRSLPGSQSHPRPGPRGNSRGGSQAHGRPGSQGCNSGSRPPRT